MRLVAADIGGTHARFAIGEIAGDGSVSIDKPTVLRVADYPSLQAAWAAFAAQQSAGLPRAAAIAVACPTDGEVLQLTNNPWVIRPATLDAQLGIDTHLIVNDFEAVGHAVASVPPEHLTHVCGPDRPLPASGVVSVVGPGTGLGVAQLFWADGRYHVIATEGGHLDFAPLDQVEDRILATLRQRHLRVSVERIVSGPGLGQIHAVLAALEGHAQPQRTDAELWRAALDGSDLTAVAALDRFCLSLGAVAGDIALAQGASAVVLAGGVGLRLARHLPRSGFAQRFTAKGRFAAKMAAMPVKLITHPEPGLYGTAAAFAQGMTS